jgi:hypothetical protein
VVDGHVRRVAPIFGRKVFNRDGSVETFTDDVIDLNLPNNNYRNTNTDDAIDLNLIVSQNAQTLTDRIINPRG